MTRSASVFLSILFAAACATEAARAEGFVDLRVGGAFTEDGDVELSVPGFSVTGETDFEDSVTGGGRLGYWFDSFPWLGLAADVSYFAPDIDDGGTEIGVIPISPLLMMRAPLADDEEFPHGRIQPFAGIGPGIFISLVDFDGSSDEESVDVGLDVHAGLKYLITPNVGIFVQYRYTWLEPEVEADGFPLDVDVEAELSTHHVAGGLGFHF
jgi:opacity protein-like surface antigen